MPAPQPPSPGPTPTRSPFSVLQLAQEPSAASTVPATVGATPSTQMQQDPSLQAGPGSTIISSIDAVTGAGFGNSENAGMLANAIMPQDIVAATGTDQNPALTVATVGSQPLVLLPSDSNAVVVGESTLSVGGAAATIADSIISVGSDGILVVPMAAGVDATMLQIVPASTAMQAITSVGGNAVFFAPGQASAVVVAGKTLAIGGNVATVSGAVISLGPSGLVVSSTGHFPFTVPLQYGSIAAKIGTSTGNVGDYVMSGLGWTPSTTPSSPQASQPSSTATTNTLKITVPIPSKISSKGSATGKSVKSSTKTSIASVMPVNLSCIVLVPLFLAVSLWP
jgi:hypothetical protein